MKEQLIVYHLISRIVSAEESKQRIGIVFKQWRLRNELGLRRTARAVNLTASNLCSIEAGKRSVGLEILKRLNKFMKEIDDERKQGYA